MILPLDSLEEEKRRLTALEGYRILDTPPEDDFNDIVKLASHICDTPISLISLVDKTRVWFKARTGIDVSESDRNVAFCSHTILQQDVMVIRDTTKDQRFCHNPLVTHDPNLRFYAGMPLINSNGFKLGTLCVLDNKPKELTEQQLFSLRILAKQVVNLLEMRTQMKQLNHVLASAEENKLALEKANTELIDVQEDSVATLEQVAELQKFLEQRERQYRELVDDASDMIYELGPDGKFTFVNQMMERITGYTKEQMTGKFFWEIITPDYRQSVIEFYGQQRRELKETSYLELQIMTAQGGRIWSGQNVRMFFKDRHVWKVSAVARDITQLKETERKLEESEKLYRLLSNNARDLISLHRADKAATITFASPSAKDIVGYTPEELKDKSILHLVIPEDREKLRSHVQPTVLTGNSVLFEFRAQKKDGTIVWLESNTHPFHDPYGKVIGFQSSTRDITLRKHFEHEIISAKEKAEEATRAKSQFLSMMSHEIRTPMNAIIGITNIMLGESPRANQLDNLNLLKFSGENLLTIINDILDFSKIEAGKIVLENIAINIKEIIEHTRNLLQPKAREKGIALVSELAPGLPSIVMGDPVRLNQIINNLLSNAIKFTEHGTVSLTVDVIAQEDNQHTIRFAVKDSGIGIPADKIGDIFESFTQAMGDTTRKFGGTGLGLTITKRLVNLMGGEINVTSTMGVGSEFSFVIQMQEGRHEKVYQNTYQPEGLQFTSHAHILVVEDNRVNQVVASNFLKKWGLQVSLANNGREATELMATKAYDVVLMDLQMPEMDGYEATGIIRSMDGSYFKEVPIIALTASAMMEIKDKVLSAGMNDFVTKPFQPEELQSKIFQFLQEDRKSLPLTTGINTSRLDEFTDADDNFKKELMGMLIQNINELKEGFDASVRQHDPSIFHRVAHKCKATIDILKYDELNKCIDDIKASLQSSGIMPSNARIRNWFHRLCNTCILNLEQEIVSLRKAS